MLGFNKNAFKQEAKLHIVRCKKFLHCYIKKYNCYNTCLPNAMIKEANNFILLSWDLQVDFKRSKKVKQPHMHVF